MSEPCFKALTRPVSMAGLPLTYVVLLVGLVVGGFIATLSFLWFLGSTVVGYVALRLVANYDPRIVEVIFRSLAKTPLPPSWFKGKGIIYRA